MNHLQIHNQTFSDFKTAKQHGIHVPIQNIIRHASVTDLMLKFKSSLKQFKRETSDYQHLIRQKDEEIAQLKETTCSGCSLVQSSPSISLVPSRYCTYFEQTICGFCFQLIIVDTLIAINRSRLQSHSIIE